ncbi:MAG: radical SAM/SPASM domain-containing protein [Treponema sp.]|nr:radical SAM/SPASM domain-containing protein [Treponema sp.]
MESIQGPGFNPEEIIFCPTSACILTCPHCFVNQKAGSLCIEDAINLLYDCASNNISKVGFSGGEPFLNLDFTCSIIERAVKLEMIFDRLMTNGAWWKNENELFEKLERVKEAGFDGKIGLSWDSFHGTSVQKIAMFITACHQIFDDESCVEILSVVNEKNKKSDDLKFKDDLIELGLTIGGYVSGYTDKKTKTGTLEILNDFSDISVPVFRFSQSLMPEKAIWKDKKWFKEDFCQEVGNVLYVHADGRVAPCCGFANEEPSLIIGNVKDSFNILMENAEKNPMVEVCYIEGLENHRKKLEKNRKLPGKTKDMCMFCAWVCRNQ